MNRTESELEFEKYRACWRAAYRNILGQSESKGDDLAAKWKIFARKSPEWFFHEAPIYYFVAEIAPALEPGKGCMQSFLERLQAAIEQGDQDFLLKPDYDWASAKQRLKQIFQDRGLQWPYG